MKLTKQLEKEILEAYNAYWDNYLKGDTEAMHPLLADEYTQVGSAESEVFSNKKEAVQFLYDTIDQVAGKLEMRNRKTTLEQQENSILIHEFCDLYALANNNWIFYSKFRASTFMQQKKDGWKITHQHSSFPDTKTEDGQNIAIDKIAEENLQLREAVKRRTVELENKTRELEIESSLERVRTVAMSMNKPDDMLDVCKTISLQLQSLGVKEIRNVQTAIFYEEKGTYMNYEYYAKHDKTFITETIYTDHEIAKAFAAKMLKGRGENYITQIEGNEKVKEWLSYQKTTNVFIDTFLETASSLNYYWFSLGPVALGISTYVILNDHELSLFKRFLNVFELAFRRYLDIEKAIAQAKEAQIELALERVRARTMAMQNSNELPDAANILFQQVQSLGMPAWSAGYCTWNEDKSAVTLWMSSEGVLQPSFTAPTTEDELFIQMRKGQEDGKIFHVVELGGDQLVKHYKYMRTLPLMGDILDSIIAAGHPLPTFQIMHHAYFSKGFLLFITYEPVPDAHDIFKRFGKVFDQTYTRFLDLQKAEAQAREAQIEVALERVRSRSIGMQKSEELKEVIKIVYQQLRHLKINLDHAGFVVDYTTGGDWHFWIADEQDIPSKITHPWFESVWANQFKEAKEKGLDFFVTNLNFEEKNKFYNELLSYVPGLPEASRDFYLRCPGLAASTVLLENVGLYIENFSGTPYTDEENHTLMRFGKVFQQTYTRFLDLQKAEAQSREAQIELGLERVRARAMAMQKSDELSELVDTVFKELTKLDFALNWCIINIIDAPSLTNMVWAANPETNKPPESYLMKFEDYPFHHSMMKGYQERKTKHVYVLEGKEKKTYDDYLFTKTEWRRVPKAAQAASRAMKRYVATFTFSNFGGLQTVGEEYLSEENLDILSRFGKVFDLTYTRFNDLQKAEAQSREAQIQLALERGRTQSMIMQHSNELDDTLRVFHEQVLLLGINSAFSFLWLPDEEKSNHIFWAAWAEDNNDATVFKSKAITYPLDRNEPATAQCLLDWKSEEPVFSYAVPPEGVKNYFAAWQELIDGVEKLRPEHFTNGLYYVEAFMKYGCFGVLLENDLTAAEKKILDRFATEFERAYTRFLDLQKAEAQARQAKIEAAMEKVRSRAMAMQKPHELVEVAELLRKEMGLLGVEELETSSIYIHHEDTKKTECWYAIKDVEHPDKQLVSDYMHIDLNETGIGKQMLAFYDSDKKQISIPMQGDARKEWINYCAEHSKVLVGFYGDNIPDRTYHLYKFSNGYMGAASPGEISTESWDLLQRATSVFSLAYTRFSDLQQAEAQTREAQIELSLERVRAKTMAMHNSADVGATAAVMVEELKKLEIETIRCGIGIMHEPGDMEVWTISNGENNKTDIIIGWLDMNMHPLLHGAFESWRNKNKSYSYELKEDDLLSYYNAINNYPGYPIRYDTASLPKLIHHNEFYFTEGTLFAFSLKQLTNEQRKIFKRFAAVFGQTYRRYLDLKKAEAQAREAQVETALERVRNRTLAMQKSDELAETAAEVFRQLISLGIEPNRLYIGIVKEETGDMEMWATDEDGTHVGKKFMFNKNENISVKKLFDGWKAKEKSVIVDMQGKELEDYFHYLNHVMHIPFKGGLTQKRRVQSVAYFSKGFIGMASPDGQGDQTIQLLERFAAVFNLTFTRFNDLKIAEAHALQAEQDLIAIKEAKQKAEEALSELQSTQKQLIQSEKMASLGELTAGIAHEIQNPLNFVNNFSEVSTELVDEMNEEMSKGNLEDAKQIANDLRQNLEKINHHGKRAGDIVKGMLQHSRSSTSTKELTDINKLADEYLRLAYHGLRAKDKSFNATLKTDYDEKIGSINIIPQDIGRVILNLITNAFYVVNEKTLSAVTTPTAVKYEPTVSVSTKKVSDNVLISVKDNGNGIPQKVLDKIFQPFFTTKPTGQGTGLGLSLSYDIVKAHGGELKVETKEGEGSEFIIQLAAV